MACIASLIERYWAFESIPGFDRRRIEALIGGLIEEHPPRGACWVADAQGILQGYLVAVFMLSLEHGGTMAEVDEIFVVAERRSQGLGARLLDAAERYMAAAGLVRLQLQVAADNEAALGFYQRRGFVGRSRYSLLDKPLALPA